MQTHKEWLSQAVYRQAIHDNLMHIQQLIDKSPRGDRCPRLTFLIKHLLAQWQTKADEIAREKQSRLSLSQNFKRDLMTTLESYVKYCREQGRTILEARLEDINYLRNLLNTTDDLTQLRESVVQRYQIMQRPPLAKLITSLDGSVLRHGLRGILENPQYSTERFKRAVTQATTSIAPDVNNNEVLAMKQQLAQMQAQIQQLMNNTEYADPLLKSSDIVSNHFRFFNAPQGIKPIN